ncbi:hypothetical protein E8A68_003533 [Escherichia coli]|nr:hypothetical protein [Escherichia coli]
MISAFDIFKIGIGPSSSHTVGPMNAGKSFIDRLESSGLLTATSHIVVDLYGSLSLTGKGHATDVAIIMGLAGNSPQDVVIDEIPAFIELVTRSGRLPVASGAHIVDFPVAKNIIFHPEMLPRHENGMRITAWKGQEALLSKTYYSVGGGFIVEEEHFGLSHDVETSVPYDFHSAGELLKMCDYNGLSISGLMMHNELALRSKAEIDAGFARIWQVMHDGIERGMNTEGVLPGPLNVPRRAVALRRQLVSSDNISNDPMNVIDWINMYALAAAVAAAELEGPVERVEAWVSPNLMKNGLGVTVPGTGMVGLPIAAALGALGGNAKAGLEVLKDATAQAIADAKALLAAGKVSVKIQEPCNEILFSRAKVWNGEKWACVTIVGGHTNIVHIETHNGVVFTQQACVAEGEQESPLTVLSRTTLAEILKFVNEVPFAAIRFILDSAKLNCALSQEGLSGKWGLHIGATLEKQCERGLLAKDLSSSIVIRTSAASDARMGGATLPAMSNSGSGNQGITATMPVVVVAEHFGADDERLARALMLSHLSAIYIHNQLPRLSALCAATTAAMGAAAGMAWLVDGRYETISMAISSMIGDVSGMICDGASNSCAMKVSTSASAAWKAVLMALDDTAVTGNEGIVAHDVEQSIANLCALASHSMQQTDRQIIEIMASKAR